MIISFSASSCACFLTPTKQLLRHPSLLCGSWTRFVWWVLLHVLRAALVLEEEHSLILQWYLPFKACSSTTAQRPRCRNPRYVMGWHWGILCIGNLILWGRILNAGYSCHECTGCVFCASKPHGIQVLFRNWSLTTCSEVQLCRQAELALPSK